MTAARRIETLLARAERGGLSYEEHSALVEEAERLLRAEDARRRAAVVREIESAAARGLGLRAGRAA